MARVCIQCRRRVIGWLTGWQRWKTFTYYTRYFILVPHLFNRHNQRYAVFSFGRTKHLTFFFRSFFRVLSVCCIDCYCRHKLVRHSVLLLSIFLLFPIATFLVVCVGVSLAFLFFPPSHFSNPFFFAASFECQTKNQAAEVKLWELLTFLLFLP